MNNDFTGQIAAFKAAGCEIVTGVMIPPAFATFWSQAAQQEFNPKVVAIGMAVLFPAPVETLDDRGAGLTTGDWWTPDDPFSSSLTGETARQLDTAMWRRPASRGRRGSASRLRSSRWLWMW